MPTLWKAQRRPGTCQISKKGFSPLLQFMWLVEGAQIEHLDLRLESSMRYQRLGLLTMPGKRPPSQRPRKNRMARRPL